VPQTTAAKAGTEIGAVETGRETRSPVISLPEACPPARALRDRLRAMAADLVASWRTGGGAGRIDRSAAGLRAAAETLVGRAGARPEHVGWTMVTIVSEFWRDRLAAAPNGRRLLLLPDCPAASDLARGGGEGSVVDGVDASARSSRSGRSKRGDEGQPDGMPHVCGPACGIATVWAAARDSGWVVESTRQAVPSIGGLLTGQYDGVLGVAKLSHLEKAFAMLPAFALPVAAVPFEPREDGGRAGLECAGILGASALDVDWLLGLVGVAGGQAAPVGDYLPVLREAAELFSPEGLVGLSERLGVERGFGLVASGDPPRTVGGGPASIAPLSATAVLSGDFVVRGGKFLRPFITLAAFDAVTGDRAGEASSVDGVTARRDAVKAAAVAIEVFHKASLVHDDIEDGDRVRYGRPTLHESCGVASAINAGDFLLGIGYRIVSGLPGIDPATRADLVAILSEAHVRLARGQGAELWWRDAADKSLSPAESLELYGLKTSPAFEAAVALGIRLAGVVPADVVDVAAYALHVGTAFQVLNDLKDWEGDRENDRQAAGDLLCGRPTLMWALALDRLNRADRDRLRSLAEQAGRPSADAALVGRGLVEVRTLYERADVFGRAVSIVAEQRRQAAQAAARCTLRSLRDVLEFLLDLAVPEGAVATADDGAVIGNGERS
jgi:geranylgeranyl pyrophosphate synthase